MKQLQRQGVDPNFVKTLENKFPLLANPEAQDYFNNTVGGCFVLLVSIHIYSKAASSLGGAIA